MMFPSEREWNAMMVFLCLFVALIGWCVIEAILWVFSHLKISWM